jgi:hypothetical protein
MGSELEYGGLYGSTTKKKGKQGHANDNPHGSLKTGLMLLAVMVAPSIPPPPPWHRVCLLSTPPIPLLRVIKTPTAARSIVRDGTSLAGSPHSPIRLRLQHALHLVTWIPFL